MNRKLTLILLLSITILAASFRFYRLSHNPPGLYWDEVSLGYNAYSILKTGKDEFGQSFPFWFKAFGEYKLPGYIYLTSISISLLGFTDLAIRFPSALAGTLSVPALYFLAYELFYKHKHRQKLALFSALFFSISPWSIQFSRAAFEANLALFFTIFASALMLKGIRDKGSWLIPSAISFILAFVTYNSSRVFVPLILISSLIIYRSQLKKKSKWVAASIVIGAVLILPVLPQQFGEQGLVRAASTTFIGKKNPLESANQLLKNYFDNFDTNYLFFHGDSIGRHSTRKLGMLHFYDLPLVLIGLYFLTKKESKKARPFILAWLLLGPLPAALTQPSPHALRSLNTLPAWILIASLGATHLTVKINQLFSRSKNKIFAAYLFLSLVVAYHTIVFLSEYHVRYPNVTALDWSDGIKEVVQIISNDYDIYDKIFLSDNVPLIYLATYFPIPPQKYQQLPDKDIKNLITIDKITYFSVAWEVDKPEKGAILFIAPHWQKPDEETPYQTVKLKNGDEVFNIWEENAGS